MNLIESENIIEEQIKKCCDVLITKAKEYSPEDADRLHNFKVSAVLHGTTMKSALAGMMAKHTTSIYDMCHSNKEFSSAQWDEKITDHINYLLLLKCVVSEDKSQKKENERSTS